MSRVLLTRVLGSIGAVFGATVLAFVIMRVLPGNPARLILGPLSTQHAVDALNHQIGLDRPLYVQYWRYISDFFQGKWGYSYSDGEQVRQLIGERAPATIELAIGSFAIAMLPAIGLALLAAGMPEQFATWLARVQNDLLDLGADLSVPGAVSDGEAENDAGRARLRVGPDYTDWLEQACDEVNATLEPLRSFVIPGGTPASAHLHVCRTVCRRAERRTIAVGEEVNPEVVRYLNRLSDMLFILARAANTAPGGEEGSEPLWSPGAHEGASAPPHS